jgi:5-methylcytosine-specific restriction endonuclease McrA
MSDGFKFDLTAKRTRLSDNDLIEALIKSAEEFGGEYFSSTQHDSLPGRRPHSATIIDRFGSWKKALQIIGIEGGRQKRHDPSELIENLEQIWKEIGYPPGKRQIKKHGLGISETPYKRYWGSVRGACEALAAFHSGLISREQLLSGNISLPERKTISLKDRWLILKQGNYKCAKCGASPSRDHSVELEIDHIYPVSRGGSNSLDNLQVLCRLCNQGKKDRE